MDMDMLILSELHHLVNDTTAKGSASSNSVSSSATILQFFVAGKYSDALQVGFRIFTSQKQDLDDLMNDLLVTRFNAYHLGIQSFIGV